MRLASSIAAVSIVIGCSRASEAPAPPPVAAAVVPLAEVTPPVQAEALPTGAEPPELPVPAKLTRKQLEEPFETNKASFHDCYAAVLEQFNFKEAEPLKVTVRVTVNPDGSVKTAETLAVEEDIFLTYHCIRERVKTFSFPKSRSESKFKFPLVLQPGD